MSIKFALKQTFKSHTFIYILPKVYLQNSDRKLETMKRAFVENTNL